uniref:Profilin n=1 Tax=Panagrellus redivivus TaxID=6233 RepID=A0A7E4W714_PANRE
MAQKVPAAIGCFTYFKDFQSIPIPESSKLSSPETITSARVFQPVASPASRRPRRCRPQIFIFCEEDAHMHALLELLDLLKPPASPDIPIHIPGCPLSVSRRAYLLIPSDPPPPPPARRGIAVGFLGAVPRVSSYRSTRLSCAHHQQAEGEQNPLRLSVARPAGNLLIMSWQALVDDNLLGTGNVSKAAILGFDGSVWAKSANFKLDASEAATAAKAFAQKDALLGSGLRFEGEKFFVLNADDERIIGKKTSNGFFIYKTGQTVIVAIYEGGVQPEMCSKTTGALADYFKSTGY